MKRFLSTLPLLMLCSTVLAGKPFAERPQIDFQSVTHYGCPRDSCEYTVRATLPGSLVRSGDHLQLTFRFVGPRGELSEPIRIDIQGNASARREERERRRQGLEPHNLLGENKLRRKQVGDLHLNLIQPGRETWTDQATHLQIEQTLRRGHRVESVPEQTIPLFHTEGYNPGRTPQSPDTE